MCLFLKNVYYILCTLRSKKISRVSKFVRRVAIQLIQLGVFGHISYQFFYQISICVKVGRSLGFWQKWWMYKFFVNGLKDFLLKSCWVFYQVFIWNRQKSLKYIAVSKTYMIFLAAAGNFSTVCIELSSHLLYDLSSMMSRFIPQRLGVDSKYGKQRRNVGSCFGHLDWNIDWPLIDGGGILSKGSLRCRVYA